MLHLGTIVGLLKSAQLSADVFSYPHEVEDVQYEQHVQEFLSLKWMTTEIVPENIQLFPLQICVYSNQITEILPWSGKAPYKQSKKILAL